MTRFTAITAVAGLAVALLILTAVPAADAKWPEKDITMVVPFKAGAASAFVAEVRECPPSIT